MKADPMIMAFMRRHWVSGKPGKYAAMIQDLQQLWTDARAELLADNEHMRTALAASVAANVVYEDLEGAYDKALEVLRECRRVLSLVDHADIPDVRLLERKVEALLAEPGAAGGS